MKSKAVVGERAVYTALGSTVCVDNIENCSQ